MEKTLPSTASAATPTPAPTLASTLFSVLASKLIPALIPILALTGLTGILLPAFGWLPALGYRQLSLQPWIELAATPALGQMILLTLWVGLAASFLALLLVHIFAVCCWNSRLWRFTEKALPSLLAIPHSALALGMLFLLAPSGLISRWLAIPFGWQRPPDLLTVNDPYGLSLILTLVLKEAPYLALMLISAASQTPVERLLAAGRSLGYSVGQSWLKLVWPQLYGKMRLPILIVLVFSLSVVDVAMIIGPSLPPLLQVQILHWLNHPDISHQLLAAAASLVLMILVLAVMGLWWLGEIGARRYLGGWLINGYRGRPAPLLTRTGKSSWSGLLIMAAGAIGVVLVWSFAWRWRFPDLLPGQWSLRGWTTLSFRLWQPLQTTLEIALSSSVIGLLLSILALENRTTRGTSERTSSRDWSAISYYLPLLLPQMTFLLGIQTLLVALHFDGHWLTVVVCHLIYVFPYCYLSLSGPWHNYDQRFTQTGRLLSGSRWRTFFTIKLPMLTTPLLTTLALAVAVSTALYLPTLMAGAGRFDTLTTEVVALSSGGNRRLLALYGILQMMVPLIFFSIALLLPGWLFRNRREMQP